MQPNYQQPQQPNYNGGQPQPGQPIRPQINQPTRPQIRSVSGVQPPLGQVPRRPVGSPQVQPRPAAPYTGVMGQTMPNQSVAPNSQSPAVNSQYPVGSVAPASQVNQSMIGNLADKVDDLSSEPEVVISHNRASAPKRFLIWLFTIIVSVGLALGAGYYLIFNYLGFPTKDEITQLTDQVKTNGEFIKSLEANIAQFSGNIASQQTSEYSNSQFKLSFKYPKDYGEINIVDQYKTVFGFSGKSAISFGITEADASSWTVYNLAGVYQDQGNYKLALDDSTSEGVTQANQALDLTNPTVIESTNGFSIYQFSAENLNADQMAEYGLDIKGRVYLVNLPNNSQYSAFVINDQTGSEDISSLLSSLKLE